METFGVVHGPRGHDEPRQTCSSFHLQKAQNLEEQTTEAIMVLKGNSNVLLSLRDFYQHLGENDLFPLKDTCSSDLSAFANQVDSFIYDSNMQIERGRLLADNIAARRTMVRLGIKTAVVFGIRSSVADPPASAEPGNGENGKIDNQHAKGFPHCEDNSLPHLSVPSSYLCFGAFHLLLMPKLSTNHDPDILRHGYHQISGPRFGRQWQWS